MPEQHISSVPAVTAENDNTLQKRDIKALLKSKGHSIKEAAKKCGMASNTISIV